MPIMTAIWRFFTTNKPNIALKPFPLKKSITGQWAWECQMDG